MTTKRYSVVLEKSSTGYCAYSPDVPGCITAGDTEEETYRNMRDALEFHFEGMREVGEPIPEPGGTAVGYVEVDVAA